MELSERQLGTVTILEVTGTIVAEEGDTLKAAIARMLEIGKRQIVLDLAELTYVDSNALGQLVASQIRASRFGTTVKLANLGERLQDLLVLTRLKTVFESFDSLEAALDSFIARR